MTSPDIRPLAVVMARLRAPVGGCPWDLVQDFASIAPFTIEEAYEVADAIARGDMNDLREELGDLALQVVYHSQMAAEVGAFTLDDVLAGIAAKMVRRHPHVFGAGDAEPTADAQAANWESLKAAEKPRAHALDGVTLGLPALLRAEKLQRRAAGTGFDWPDAVGPRAKIDEELAEIAAASGNQIAEEVGDLLFSVVNYARHLGVDAEAALRGANAKFEARFAAMEALAGDGFSGLDLDAKEALWHVVKRG